MTSVTFAECRRRSWRRRRRRRRISSMMNTQKLPYQMVTTRVHTNHTTVVILKNTDQTNGMGAPGTTTQFDNEGPKMTKTK
jgi:hypothetical protein